MLAFLLDLDGANDSHTVGEQPGGDVLAVREDTCTDAGKVAEEEIAHRPLRLDLDDQQIRCASGFRFVIRIR